MQFRVLGAILATGVMVLMSGAANAGLDADCRVFVSDAEGHAKLSSADVTAPVFCQCYVSVVEEQDAEIKANIKGAMAEIATEMSTSEDSSFGAAKTVTGIKMADYQSAESAAFMRGLPAAFGLYREIARAYEDGEGCPSSQFTEN